MKIYDIQLQGDYTIFKLFFFYSYRYILIGLKFKYYLFLPEHNFDRPNAAESRRYSSIQSSKICKENSKALCFMSSRSLAHTLAFPSY